MKRRAFIKSSVVAATTPTFMTACDKNNLQPYRASIRGFIFSDAHIGWKNKKQPSYAAQKSAISTIKDYFGDLDLVFDTGDVHHGNLKEPEKNQARAFWLEEMAGKFPQALFHYVPGNHELARGINDVEAAVAELGSFALRPYYSFDFRGIHFISLPQLQDTILITEETINWLRRDLELNREKTTLVFSHNSLKDTTFAGGSTIYRVTVNSQEVMDLLDSHGQVLCWFHGHNHQYEIVNKANRLYVSNGRIGGFDPPKHWGDFGQGHLGGVYFEVGSQGLVVKCFSATENGFFEDFGKPHLSNHVEQSTSYDERGSFNYYSGHGLIHGHNKYLHYNHYLTNKKAQLMLLDNGSTSINTNYDFSFDTAFSHPSGTRNKVLGYHITPKTVGFKKIQNGLLIEPGENVDVNIRLPVEKYKYDGYLSRSGYYRCGLGSAYYLDVVTDHSDLELIVEYKVMDKNHNICHQNSTTEAIDSSLKRRRFAIYIPKKTEVAPADYKTYLFVSITIKDCPKDLEINSIQIIPRDGNDSNSHVSVDGKLLHNGTLNQMEINKSKYSEINIRGIDKPKTLYIKTPVVQWQVRNATATVLDNGYKIQALRHQYLKKSHIIMTPTKPRPFYINELFGITACSVLTSDDSILIADIEKQTSEVEVVLISNRPPKQYKGLELQKKSDFEYLMTVKSDEVSLFF